MTQENKSSQGSKNPDHFSGKRALADGEVDLAPFKKRVRFFSSDDFKEVTNDTQESSGANNLDVKVSDAGEENEMEITPIHEKRASLSQLEISESGVTGNDDGSREHEKESRELTEGGQNLEGGNRVEGVQEAAMKDGSGGSSAPAGGEEQSKGDICYRRRKAKKISSLQDGNPVVQEPEGESDNTGDGLQQLDAVVSEENPIQKTEGGSGDACLPTDDTAFESRVDRSGEDDCHDEEVQIAATEVGEMSVDDVVGEEEYIPETEEAAVKDGGGACSAAIGSPVEYEVNRIDEAQEAAVKDGHDGSGGPSDNKLVEEDEPEMIQDGDACGGDESNTIIDSENGEGDGDGEEQGKHVAVEDEGLGDNSNSAPGSEEPIEGGEKPVDYVTMIHDGGQDCSDNALGDGKQSQEPELVTKHAGTIDGSSEGGSHEQGQVAAMEDGGNENIRNSEPVVEEQSNKGKEPVKADDDYEEGELVAMEDGGNENFRTSETGVEEQSNKGKEVEADDHNEQGHLVAMEDGGNEIFRNSETGVEEQSSKGKEPMDVDDHHEQGQQQTAIEDGDDGNAADVVVSGEDVEEDKKGKKPAEYVASRKDPDSNQNATDVVNNPDAEGEGEGEGDDNDQIQQAAFEDPDANMAIQGDMQTQQDPMIAMDLRKRTRSIYEQGEVSQNVGGEDTPGEEARKKCKYGNEGGSTSALCLHGDVGYNEPPIIQQDNHSVMLFGVAIPCEPEEPDVAITNTNNGLESGSDIAAGGGEFVIGSPPMQQPTDGIQLFGVYITEEQVQPMRGIQLFGVYITEEQRVQLSVEMENRDGGNSHGGGESSVQPPKCGLRLFGFDI